MQEIRQKYYFPAFANNNCKGVKYFQTCVQDKKISISQSTSEFIIIPERDLGPEDVMQIHLLPELPPSRSYANITAIDISSRYTFAHPGSNPKAVNTAKVIIHTLTRHAYLGTLLTTDKTNSSSQMWYTTWINSQKLHSVMQPRCRHILSES